ncbi:DNRLRE domain-containing protein [Lentzea sp. BCCO 10_0856]|uniref:DNRLRE domain-containing protein n=1 Tax=Lentzea miocenica TaxID=3095431 RepID=A0ABU4TCV7_9PSEU|nr:DNRLRE domain-containing protein [Lentzea sp. BCCO 10_0856]MDX8036021.1 DNRLRE domain-containing protein [Lentzea sp. BCCO 10_0856]
MLTPRFFALPKKLLVVLSLTALAVVGLPAGPPINGPGHLPDLGLSGLWQSITGWFGGRAEAEPRPQQQQARREPPKRVRELTERRTPSVRLFQMSDGQVEAEVSPRPTAFKDAQGRWQDIDPTVRETPRDGYRFVNNTNGFTSLFGESTDKLARFEAAGKRIALGIDGVARGITPKVEKSTVTYSGAFDGADLVYQVTGEALKENIVLAKAPKDATYRFTLDLAGVTARALPDGVIGFFDNPDAPPVFVMPKPFMFDSSPDRKSPHGKVWSDKVTQTVEQQGSKITVTVKADQGWLSAKERQYPVVIDPTIKLVPTPTTGQDVQIWSDSPDRNDGSSYQLSVGTDAWGKARTLIKFDTSVVPAGTALTSAKLRLYYDSELWTAANSNVHEVRRVTQGWSEDTATWNSINAAFAEAALSTATKQANVGNVWHEWDVRNIAQQWVSGSASNFGLMVKSTDETLSRGGAIYQASEYAYNGETENAPKLILSYGRPSADLRAPTKIFATGAELNWGPYVDPDVNNPADDAVEYQVHRSVFQAFTPQESTLVAPLAPATVTYTDTTARPTPADSPDPFGNAYYYMVAVKTRDGQVIPGPTQLVRLPKAGFITQVFRGGADDATLSSNQPNTNLDTLGGQPWLMAGKGSGTYGTTRAAVRFRDLSALPAGARVTNAEMTLWGFYTVGSGAIFDGHPLTKSFVENQVSWNRASTATAWTTPGGDIGAASDNVSGITNDPNRHIWDLTAAAQGWVDNPATNYGYEVKLRDEAGPTQRVLFLSDEAAEPHLRPKLTVTYTQPIAEMTYYAPDTPSIRMIPGDEYTIPVTVTNSTTTTWRSADQVVSYRWNLPDGTDVTTGGNRLETALPADVPPGGSVTVQAKVKTPIQSEAGNKREQFVLNWDLRNKTNGTWLSATGGIPALPQNVTVEDPTSDQLGLEKFYSYAGKSTGAASNVLVNQFAGNTVWSYDAFTNPGRGLNTFVRMTYNSMDTSATSLGQGWSLAASGLTRLGAYLELHPKGQDHPSRITLPDGDGTSHTFELNKNNSSDPAQWTYDKPAGVHLYVQRDGAAEKSRRWKMTRPDRTEFLFDDEGWLTAVREKNGNEQRFTYTERRSNNQPRKFLAYVTDPSGRQTLTLDYWEKGETQNPKIIDNVQSLKDVSGRTITFSYDDKGLLTQFVDGSGTSLAKTFKFTYDATQGNKNVKLVKVTDPRNHDTGLAYYTAPVDPKDKWKLRTITDRLNFTTTFAYADPDGSAGSEVESTITDAENRVSTYRIDGYGRPLRTTNAKSQTTALEWDADNNVVKLTEDNGAVSTWAYDAKTGYPTSVRDAEAVANNWPAMTMGYQSSLNGYVADLTSKTSPEGRTWAFAYDGKGNLASVTDPKGVPTPSPDDYKTVYSYDAFGQLLTTTDANENTTTYSEFDPTGFPKKTTDPYNNSTNLAYDVRGNVLSLNDALGKTTTFTYDVFGRPLETKAPKDQAAGQFITSPAPVYDANDNVTQATAPNGAVSTAVYDNADQVSSTTAPKDTPTGPERRNSYTYDKVGNLKTETQPLGNLTSGDPNDYVLRYDYDEIYQLTTTTNAGSKKTTYEYDRVGNVITVVDARKNATADTTDYTTKVTYDLNHRAVDTIDAAGKVDHVGYDRDGNITSKRDKENNTTTLVYDERSNLVEARVPHKAGVTRVTKFEFDEAGNQTRVISPRGVETTDDADDFAVQTVFDKLNRPVEKLSAFDKDDVLYKTADKTTYAYDQVGRIKEVSAPPSQGQTVRNVSKYSYFDNGWVRTSTDPWDIVTAYDYTPLGQQASRTLTSAGGSSGRTMIWDYYPDGKPKSRSDSGVPVGLHVALTDNSDIGFIDLAGNWSTATAGQGFQGYDYRSTARGTGGTTFSWKPVIPADGSYEVFVKYPSGVSGSATNAPHKVETGTATSTVPVNQTQRGGEWVSLGSFAFAAGTAAKITVSDNADGTVLADAVKLVRNNSGEPDNESKTFTNTYDANSNLTSITDTSPGAKADAYALTYNGLNQLTKIEEKLASVVKATTTFSYNENGAPLTRGHDKQTAEFTYNPLDLIEQVRNTETGGSPKVTSYTYTDRWQVKEQTKSNGNKVVHGYHLDGALASQVESKSNGTLVAQHLIDYSANGHRTKDASKVQNADNSSAYLDEAREYDYDPRDRLRKLTKKSAAGAVLETEDYVHDANSNVVSSTVEGTTTTFNYDRNRLLSASASGTTSSYNYDPFGRLDTVTAGGQIVQSYKYDGFDRTVEHRKQGAGGLKTTTYAYDPLDRTTTKTEDGKTTDFAYLGLTDKVVSEEIAGQLQRTYQYDAFGQRLAQIKKDTDGTGPEVAEDSYYGYNAHTDVETLTKDNGDTRATYGYTAYGKDDEQAFTGIDKPDAQQPGKEPFNFYRYNGKRFDPASGSYDMGFRDYNPGLNRFLTRDSYNGALADLDLGGDAFTGNRYAFAGGNPISGVEADGHGICADDACLYVCPLSCSDADAAAITERMAADTQAAWDHDYSPKSNDYETVATELNAGRVHQMGDPYWDRMGSTPKDETACFGRLGCDKALEYLFDHKDDVAGAKKIAANYCVDNFSECYEDAEAEGTFTELIDIAVTVLAGRRTGGSVKPNVAAPASKFSQLTHASEGIKPYSVQRTVTAGHKGAIQAHHLIEKRFARQMGGNTDDWATIVLTRSEHQVFTNAWRQAIPTGPGGTALASRAQIENAARRIYADYPEILKALGL